MYKIGVQLYTIRTMLGTELNMRDALSKIKDMGYDCVQLVDFGSAKDIEPCCEYCRQIGLEFAGLLTSMGACEERHKELFALCNAFDIPDIGVSTEEMDYEDVLKFIDRANSFAKKAKQNGVTFSYHNHSHEFIRTSCGKTVMNLLFDGLDKENVLFMPDTFWVQHGGFDVRYFIELVRGRASVVHIKDIKRTKQGHFFAPVGQGNLYIKGIVETALNAGISCFIVEQDECEKDPLDCLNDSYKYLKNVLENVGGQ